ncbi:MAG: hypothetical protein LBJ73_02655 [Rickettsiales bacterium]|jgi:predicted phage terminase large subunit-like protein|nr:hypothetical protein [Rickettsiales bacterium]
MSRVYQSFENSTPFLIGYRELKIPIVDSDGTPAWPQLFPLSKVEQLRETVGARHFSSQMMLEYISEEKARLDPGALHFYSGEFNPGTATIEVEERLAASRQSVERRSQVEDVNNNESPSLCALRSFTLTGMAMYWDPSGGRVKSDGSVCVLIYRDDRNRRVFIHDILYLTVSDEDLHPLATQCGAVLDFMRRHGTNRIAIEVNGIGNALPEIMRKAAQKRGQPVVVQKIVNHQRKETRILDSIEPLLTTGRMHAHRRVANTPLLSEMLGWSPLGASQYDDGLDAVAGALRIQPIPIRPLSAGAQILKARTDFKV